MVDFLLEVGTEELPASFVHSAMEQWQHRIPLALSAVQLTPSSIQIFGTPRRLAVLLSELPDQQPDRILDVKGPPASLAYKDGNLTPAGLGFARKQGVDPSKLELRPTDKGEFVFAIQSVLGQPTESILQTESLSWITSLTGERLMRWGSGELKFPRPIRWLVALLDDRILPISLEGIESGRITQAHRVLHPDPVVVTQASGYVRQLVEAFVQPDVAERRTRIRSQVEQLAQTVNGVAEIPAALLQEVTQLVEWPTAVLGQFDSAFLQLPAAVIKTVMVTHQRYFPVHDPSDLQRLLPYFITISNGDPAQSAVIAAGNGRVVRARLNDGQFFYTEDQKKPLEARVEALKPVLFAQDLGSVWDKVQRIRQIAQQISLQLQLDPAQDSEIQRTALLCKADLVTQMVYEFPELQGLMGADYARRSGELESVAEGIWQHYWPIRAGDPLPTGLNGQIVGIADRLDSLVSLFKLGKVPTGSSDPFALRRAANSILLILWGSGLAVDLQQLIRFGVGQYASQQPQTETLLTDFFLTRIQSLLQEEHRIDYDLVNAVLGASDPILAERALADIQTCLKRAQFFQHLRRSGELAELYPTLNRSARLAAQGDLPLKILDPNGVVNPELFQDPSEQAFYRVCESLYQQSQSTQPDFHQLTQALLTAASIVSQFFEAVLVMDPDPAVKANRLNLLGILRNHARLLGDFGSVVMAANG